MSEAQMNPEETAPCCENCKALAKSLRTLQEKYERAMCEITANRMAAQQSEIYPSGIKGERHYPAGDYA
jgi:hypothetical protein